VSSELTTMTPTYWEVCRNPQFMLDHLRRSFSERKLLLVSCERKLLLVGCAVCRLVWHTFTDERSRTAIEVVERYVDGLARHVDMVKANQAAVEALRELLSPADPSLNVASHAGRCSMLAARDLTNTPEGDNRLPALWEKVVQGTASAQSTEQVHYRQNRRLTANVLRDVFGNPFRTPTPLPHPVLTWNDHTVPRIAEGIYAERAFRRMPILHDALLDAGCTDEALLSHCRNPEGHVLGCWAIDLLTGRE
jgi:hypothetical protein